MAATSGVLMRKQEPRITSEASHGAGFLLSQEHGE